MKKAIVLINALSSDPTEDELDVLEQACLVEETLEQLGIESERVLMDFNIQAAVAQITGLSPDFVVNLVEGVAQDARLIHWAPALLEHLKIPFTGCGSESMYITSNKTLTKKLLLANGIPTPELVTDIQSGRFNPNKKYIAKPVWEDASVGISDANVLDGELAKINAFLSENQNRTWFFEEFIKGREFNISVLGGKNGPEVLPMAEIVFDSFPEGKPHIIGYEAKWDEDSFEYKHTNRRFGVEQEMPDLAAKLGNICHQCWQLFDLKGYVRIDFRVDEQNNPYVLEINANPCLSPDAGFYAAAMEAGFSFDNVLTRIIEDAHSSVII
ncbi:MAG: D-alanine--D-alanine ligase [Bacteroidetes bacterium HGW-Bacteroidetes-16]|jgi:D-alanine-D-alanine ligase|nr:MAG: D-alanine--D-alanine ligase [Bacteroidetes bacterium HGW-Bacteroidetes-16]